jgi:hypothetical protein
MPELLSPINRLRTFILSLPDALQPQMKWEELQAKPDEGFYSHFGQFDPHGDRTWSEAVFAHILKVSHHKFREEYETYAVCMREAEDSGQEQHDAHRVAFQKVFKIPTSIPLEFQQKISSKIMKKYRDAKRKKTRRDEQRGQEPTEKAPNSQVPLQDHSKRSSDLDIRVKWERLIWVGYPDRRNWNVEDTSSVCIHLDEDNCKQFPMEMKWLNDALEQQLKEDEGLKPFWKRESGCWTLHQGLVTMLLAKTKSECPIELHSWKWLTKKIKNDGLRSHLLDTSTSTVFILHFTSLKPNNLDEIYDAIHSLDRELEFPVRPFPHMAEMLQERQKMPDIRRLDEMAKKGGTDFSFRPITCFGEEPCRLQTHSTTISKRSHSGSGNHVKRERNENGCLFRHPNPKTPKTVSRGFYTFHQEEIPSLREFGEFRVFIIGGRIVARARTSWDLENKEILGVHGVFKRTFESVYLQDLELEDLDTYALQIWKDLLAQSDASRVFESLNIGVRLDIGVCKGKFFVNEIGRQWDSHFFSQFICAEPRIEICDEMAASICGYFL